MKLQVAIDRVTLEHALVLLDEIKDIVDIVEIGTSLIKEYGMESVRKIRAKAPELTLLADCKSMDEGAYEFEAVYAAGADIATVMGAAAFGTVSACYEVAMNRKRGILIDLLETSEVKIEAFENMDKGIYCVHLPKDGPQEDVVQKVKSFCEKHPGLHQVAVAGGVTLRHIPLLKSLPIEVCIVGSAVTAAKDPRRMAQDFIQAMRR